MGALAQHVRLEHLTVELLVADAHLGGEPLALLDGAVELGEATGQVTAVDAQAGP